MVAVSLKTKDKKIIPYLMYVMKYDFDDEVKKEASNSINYINESIFTDKEEVPEDKKKQKLKRIQELEQLINKLKNEPDIVKQPRKNIKRTPQYRKDGVNDLGTDYRK